MFQVTAELPDQTAVSILLMSLLSKIEVQQKLLGAEEYEIKKV